MRIAFTQWNDRLRCQTLARRIDDRYCLEMLYKWVVAERYIFLKRLLEERLKQRCLDGLKNECLSRQSHRAQSCHVLRDAREKANLQSHLFQWHSRLDAQRQAEHIAFEFHAPKITQEVVQLWTRNFAHLQKLDRWAKDADFYFACKNLLKRWQAATVESKKQKRRNAYMQVRRRSKMSLATSVLQRWRLVSAQNTDMQQQASLTYQNQLLGVGTKLFDYWKGQSDLRLDQDHQAVQHYNRRLVERHLYTWIEKLEDESRLEEMADLNYDMRIRNVAFGWLHKLRIRLIELKGREANAENLRKWYEKRHSLNLLRRWQDKTSRKLNRPPQEIRVSPETNRWRPRAADNDDDPTKRAGDWTEFDLGDWVPALEAQSSTTPLPGYLSTPSKRAARAKALVKVSTTPAGTPFESRLRSQLGTTPRMSRRTGFGRSTTALKGSTFGAILEDSPRTPSAGRL
jgi:protein SFI1